MKKMFLFSIFALFLSTQALFALTGREIVEKSDKLMQPDSARSKVHMEIYKGDKVVKKEFKLYAKKYKNSDKTLVEFLKPTKIKVLSHSYKTRDDDQWLRLSSGKVKRIIGDDKGKSFVQSHMTYEDLQARQIDDYSYKNIGSAKVMGYDCFKVQAVKTKGTKVYDKNILYIRKSDYFLVKIDFYLKGKLFKNLENHKIKKIEKILTPMEIVVKLSNGKGKTVLKIKVVQYNIDINNSKFSKDALR